MTAQYSEEQQKAINHYRGPLLCLAGPGSGKTRVITARTHRLITEHGVAPEHILVITFTKAAALEMERRFLLLSGGKGSAVTFGTFHSVFFRILRHAYGYSAAHILREEEKIEILRGLLRHIPMETPDESELIADLLSEISAVKGNMTELAHYYSKTCPEESFRTLYEAYERELRRRNKIDFDDMLTLCYELLTARQDVLALWQRKYTHILIDEFQDINRIQYEIIRMLALPENHLFVVGDDDQSIYQFRGARPELMFSFRKDYPGLSQLQLSTNYRCGGAIVEAANHLIQKNQRRFDKELRAHRAWGAAPDLRVFPNMRRENEAIAALIRSYREQGTPYHEMAVLFRTNLGPRLLANQLMEYNIPFRLGDAMPNLYDHWMVKDLLAYIRVAAGSKSRSDYLRMINRPNRYVRRDAFPEENVTLRSLLRYYRDQEWMLERLLQMNEDLRLLRLLSPFSAIHYIRKKIGYDDFVEEYAKKRRMRPEELFEILDAVMEGAKPYKTFEDWYAGMEEYARQLEEQRKKEQTEEDFLVLSTMHSAKGLEYRVVILPDCNEGVTPHPKAVLAEEVEEERRMFYVAMTRARDYLHIFSVEERFDRKAEPSRFVAELKAET